MAERRRGVLAPASIYYAYAREDEDLRGRLEKHLSLLRRQGLIAEWHDHKILAGSNRARAVDLHLATASIILLLVSPDFLDSDYCYGVEMQRALRLHEAGRVRIIPVILRSVDWKSTPFAHLQCLPADGKPVKLWPDLDAAFLDVALGIRRVVEALRASSAGEQSRSLGQAYLEYAAISLEQQNRERFIKEVRDRWITGVLDASLHNAALLVLGFRELPEALANPWRLLVQETNQAGRVLPPAISITQVYDEADGQLLILGEPGAGKTTLLLTLARDLLSRAEIDEFRHLPVVFNLSSWAEKRRPLVFWLVEELSNRYHVPRGLGDSWLETGQLMLLLDGLDEVAAEHRPACVLAINEYYQHHLLSPLVVCSRREEYIVQQARFTLRRSIMLQPLTDDTIDEYLYDAGEQLRALRETLREDEDLRVMARTPLMLNILLLTYQDAAPDDLLVVRMANERRRRIFERYVARMYGRRGVSSDYTLQQTLHWLRYLAQQMKRYGQTEFYIERMQKDWLIDQRLRQMYRFSVLLICALLGGTIGILVGMLSFGSVAMLICGLGFGVIGAMGEVLYSKISPTKAFTFSTQVVRQEWFTLMILILVGGLVGGLDASPTSLYIKYNQLTNLALEPMTDKIVCGFWLKRWKHA